MTQENASTMMVRSAVATVESVLRMPHLARMEVTPAKKAEPNASTTHMMIHLLDFSSTTIAQMGRGCKGEVGNVEGGECKAQSRGIERGEDPFGVLNGSKTPLRGIERGIERVEDPSLAKLCSCSPCKRSFSML